MLKLLADELLKKSGHSKYWLGKGLGMSSQNLNKLLNNETKAIYYSTLEALCQMFDCAPGDLFLYDKDAPENNGRADGGQPGQ